MLKDNIWAADLRWMGSLSSFYHSVNYLLCVIHVFTSNALENKRTKTVLHGFIEIVNDLNLNHINYGLTKEKKFIIALCKNG